MEHLEIMIEKAQSVIDRNACIVTVHDFLISPERMEKFDAACMLIQVVGELAKRIDGWTSSNLFIHYPEVYWRGVFGCRNIISHDYGNVSPEQIFKIIKNHLPVLIECVHHIIDDLNQGFYPELFVNEVSGGDEKGNVK